MTDERTHRRHLDLIELLSSSIGIGGEPSAIPEAFRDVWRLTLGENGNQSVAQKLTKRERHAQR